MNGADVKVNSDTAMKHTTVYACVNVKAQGISSVPFNLYKKTANGREKAVKHPLFKILNHFMLVLLQVLEHKTHSDTHCGLAQLETLWTFPS